MVVEKTGEQEIMFRAQALLPCLTSLHLVEPGRDVGPALSQIPELRSLFFSNFAWADMEETHLATFSRLTSLTLRYGCILYSIQINAFLSQQPI